MKKALLDTDIVSYFLKGNALVIEKVQRYINEHGRLTLSEITYYEILAGLEFKKAEKQTAAFKTFFDQCEVIRLNRLSAEISASIYGELRRKGLVVGTADLLIAGMAVANNLSLISNNLKHYRPIDSLIVESWLTPER